MSEMSGDEKENEVTADTNSEELKKKPDIDDTISRLLRRKVDVDAQEGEDSAE
jgi:hypothetical protein